MNVLCEVSIIYNLQLLCSTDTVECHFDVKLARYFKGWQLCDMKYFSWNLCCFDIARRYRGVSSQRVNFF